MQIERGDTKPIFCFVFFVSVFPDKENADGGSVTLLFCIFFFVDRVVHLENFYKKLPGGFGA